MTRSRGPIWLVIKGGPRDGQVLSFDTDRVTIGRAPDADVRFDPELDLAVSAHQATLAWGEGAWFVRDLGSRNGTLVGGVPVHGDAPIEHGDLVSFGGDGPALSFLERPPDDTHVPAADGPTVQDKPDGVTQLIRVEVGKETRRLRYLVLALAGTLALVFFASRDRPALPPGWETERALLLQFVDSVLRAGDEGGRALAGEMEALAEALSQSQGQVRALRRDLESEQQSETSAETLRNELQSATLALQRQQLAAAVDYQDIAERHQESVAAIWVDVGGGEIFTGTAFLVADGVLITSGHVLSGQDGDRTPQRIAVQFSGRTSVLAATTLAVSTVHDLALIQLQPGLAGLPSPIGLNHRPDTIPEGRPVVLIGYPLGGAQPATGGTATSRPIVSLGILMEASANEARVQGYGAEGASGSPVFDDQGSVVGVVRGGVRDAPVQTLLAVSSVAVSELLSATR